MRNEAKHSHGLGDTLTKIDSSEWEITNRLLDVDTGETLYRLRESDGDFTEMMTESQLSRSYKTDEPQ